MFDVKLHGTKKKRKNKNVSLMGVVKQKKEVKKEIRIIYCLRALLGNKCAMKSNECVEPL